MKQAPASRAVAKPVPQAQQEDPREYQLGQLRRRYSPKETIDNGATLVKFKISPSDPDFPFELAALECNLYVPQLYPDDPPRLKVTNKDIPRGFAVNVERGFDGLVSERKGATLLALTNALDKNLEAFLSERKAETIKLVANADTRHLSSAPIRAVEPPKQTTFAPEQTGSSAETGENKNTTNSQSKPRQPEIIFSAAEKEDAAKRRALETRQLEARLGRLPLYKKSGDGIAYTLPVEPANRSQLPLAVRTVKTVKLFVPLLYPLQPCRIQLENVEGEEKEAIEKAFEKNAREKPQFSLAGHVNALAQRMHLMAEKLATEDVSILPQRPAKKVEQETKAAVEAPETVSNDQIDDRSHIHVIPRPPEWDIVEHSDLSDSSDDYSYDSGDESDEAPGDVEVNLGDESKPGSHTAPSQNPERGTALSFPSLSLHGVELLELISLNLTIKCERCKTTAELRGLKNNAPQTATCNKCTTVLAVTYRRDLMHPTHIRAGFLDLENCTAVDMLPSSFLPTCASCSETFPLPGIVAVRGDTSSQNCRSCHAKLVFELPDLKFLFISPASAQNAANALPKRKKKDLLGLKAGEPLPKNGRCRHYAKSYRWFRFSCCGKVYACDRCHDEGEEHPNEHANRMICGWCSREGVYKPEECGVCGKAVVGRKGRGFWEGGKGTRDRTRMSRKDPRKFKRIGGTDAKK